VSSGIVRRVDFVTVAVLDIRGECSAGARELSSVSYCGGGEGGSATLVRIVRNGGGAVRASTIARVEVQAMRAQGLQPQARSGAKGAARPR